MFAASPCLEGKNKTKKLRRLHFSLRLHEVSLLQNCVWPRHLACQTALFTQKLSQVRQETEMPKRNQGVPQPQIPDAASMCTPHHHLCRRRGRGKGKVEGTAHRAGLRAQKAARKSASAQPSPRMEERKPAPSALPSL